MDTINTNFYNNLSTMAKWVAPCTFARTEKAPIDNKSVFQTYQDLITYIDDPVSGTAYPGQIVSVTADIDDTKNGAYVLLPESYEIPPETEGGEPTQGIHLRPRMLAASESIPSPTPKVFATEAAALAYAATPEATVGEIVYVTENNRAYVVQSGTAYRTATHQEVLDATATATVYWLDGNPDPQP